MTSRTARPSGRTTGITLALLLALLALLALALSDRALSPGVPALPGPIGSVQQGSQPA